MIIIKLTCRCGSSFDITRVFKGDKLSCPNCNREYPDEIAASLKNYLSAEEKLSSILQQKKDYISKYQFSLSEDLGYS